MSTADSIRVYLFACYLPRCLSARRLAKAGNNLDNHRSASDNFACWANAELHGSCWGRCQPGIQWAVQERTAQHNQEGVYTAPKEIGIYHVIAIATSDGAALAQAVAKVTVVTHYDTSPN